MVCPHCNYKHGYEFDEGDIEGAHGNFYHLSNNIKAIRNEESYDKDEITVFVCPQCMKVFGDKSW